MPDRFGRFVLLGELETGWRGTEYRAAALAGPDLERLVSLLRIPPPLSAREAVLEHLQAAARLGGPHAVPIHEVGRVDGAAFVASELVEGKSLRAVLARSAEEAMPIAPDNALQVASRVAAALEHAHGHSSPGGAPFVHGMIGSDNVLVSYDGEVAVRGFGWWTSGAWEGHLPEDELRRLAPEQRGGTADPRSDVFGVGALLLECLTGLPPDAPLADLHTSDGEPVPPPLAEVLAKALRPDPAGRFADARELRRALDALLFSGDVSPTTFNLAYLMYTLFRDVVEQEARVLEAERQASYADHVLEIPHPAPAGEAAHPPASPGRPAPAPAPPAAASVHPGPAHHPAAPSARGTGGRPATARAAASRPAPPGSGLAVKLGLSGLALAAIAAGAFFYLRPAPVPAPTPEPTLPPEEVAALARVRELEARLASFEDEKAQAEVAAAEAVRERLEAEAAKKGRAVDRAAVARAQEEATRQARAEQEQRREAERKQIAEEMQAEEARLAAARAAATPSPTSPSLLSRTPAPTPLPIGIATAVDVSGPAAGEAPLAPATMAPAGAGTPPVAATTPAAAASAPAATLAPVTVPPATAPPTGAPPSTVAGAVPVPTTPTPPARAAAPAAPSGPVIHAADEPGVTAPILQKGPPVVYPQLARITRAQGVVVVSALVDEKGRVTEARAVSPGNEILREAAVAHVTKRRYLPGKKDGVPVKVRIIVHVTFKFQN